MEMEKSHEMGSVDSFDEWEEIPRPTEQKAPPSAEQTDENPESEAPVELAGESPEASDAENADKGAGRAEKTDADAEPCVEGESCDPDVSAWLHLAEASLQSDGTRYDEALDGSVGDSTFSLLQNEALAADDSDDESTDIDEDEDKDEDVVVCKERGGSFLRAVLLPTLGASVVLLGLSVFALSQARGNVALTRDAVLFTQTQTGQNSSRMKCTTAGSTCTAVPVHKDEPELHPCDPAVEPEFPRGPPGNEEAAGSSCTSDLVDARARISALEEELTLHDMLHRGEDRSPGDASSGEGVGPSPGPDGAVPTSDEAECRKACKNLSSSKGEKKCKVSCKKHAAGKASQRSKELEDKVDELMRSRNALMREKEQWKLREAELLQEQKEREAKLRARTAEQFREKMKWKKSSERWHEAFKALRSNQGHGAAGGGDSWKGFSRLGRLVRHGLNNMGCSGQ